MPTHKFGLWTGPRSLTETMLRPGDKIFLDVGDVWFCRVAGHKKLPVPVNIYWNAGSGTVLRARNELNGRFPEIAAEIASIHDLKIEPIVIPIPKPAALTFDDDGYSHRRFGFSSSTLAHRYTAELPLRAPHQDGFQFISASA